MNFYLSIKILVFILITLLSLCSCEPSRTLFNKENTRIDQKFSGSFRNANFKTDSLTVQTRVARSSPITILNLCGIYSKNISNSVEIQIIENRKLEIKYTDSSISKTKTLYGKLKKKGYFQCYTKRKVIQIPPFISFIYSRRLIDRLRIGVSQSGDLLIHNKYLSEGNIFIFGSGVNYKELYYFKTLQF